MKKYFQISVIICFTSIPVFGQISQEWVARYHFYSMDQANDIAVDDSGNVYVTGSSESSTPNGAKFDYATIKYN